MAKKNQTKNQLRIIGGQWKGRKLNFVDAPGLRPTLDRVRETLFNWLQADIYNATCLDLFSGSGALSFEALSRGAEHVTIIDNNRATIAQIKTNLNKLHCSQASIYQQKAEDFLSSSIEQSKKASYDLVFLDPPFNKGLLLPICHLLEQQQLLHQDSLVYIETEANLSLQELPDNWRIYKEKRSSQLAYYLFIHD